MPVDIPLSISSHRQMFEVFREMHTVRNFRLVLCVQASQDHMAIGYEGLKRVVAMEQAAGRFDYLSSHPLVVRTIWTPPESYHYPEG